MLERIALLSAGGYRCVAFDHRAHGESGGKRTSFGFHESRDVVAVLDLIRRNWPAEPRAAFGVSMGAAAICFAATHLQGVDAFILESCYVDIGTAFANRLKNGYPTWYQRLSRGVVWMSERRLGLRLADLVPADYIGDLAPAPVLLLTGSNDHHAPPAPSRLPFPGALPAPARAGLRLPRRLRNPGQRPRGARADPGPGHPPGLDGRVDLPLAHRPLTGRGDGRRRAAPVPVPRGLAGPA